MEQLFWRIVIIVWIFDVGWLKTDRYIVIRYIAYLHILYTSKPAYIQQIKNYDSKIVRVFEYNNSGTIRYRTAYDLH